MSIIFYLSYVDKYTHRDLIILDKLISRFIDIWINRHIDKSMCR